MNQQPASQRPGRKRSVKERFLLINRDRLQRISENLSERHREILELLPLLFHVNHALLPGYVSSKTPCGICEYSPSREVERAARRLSRAFELKKRAQRVYDIEGLYLMGSSGTVAHSEHSDFDIWVCHRRGLDAEGLTELQKKAEILEQWADSFDLEVHFFVFNAEEFRQGQGSQLSSESSGSTQHYLLLDEFYRSGIVLSGLFPIWWLVPCEQEHEYEDSVARLIERREIRPGDFIDFGSVAHIPADEFFGATLWQLYKSINSPYKSVIKLLLMEAYANEYPDIELLSLRYKRMVHGGLIDIDHIDPYLMMYHKVEEYLMTQHDKIRVDLLRRCFYLKVEPRLSYEPRHGNITWRREAMQHLVDGWNWQPARIMTLDRQQEWKLETVLEERRSLVSALTQGYRMLSRFARGQNEIARISKSDLTILGRKLQGAFERKSGKVELVNRGIAPSLHESALSLHRFSNEEAQGWELYRGNVTPEQVIGQKPLKRDHQLIELLTWCHFNSLIDSHSRMVQHQCGELTSQELRNVLETLEKEFPGGYVSGAKSEELLQTARLRRACLFVNVGQEPKLKMSKDGAHIASDRSNAFSYGAMHENLLLSFDLVLTTTWEEVYTFRYEGITGLLDCISEYLRWSPCSTRQPPIEMDIHCYSSSYGAIITNTVRTLFKQITRCFYRDHKGQQPCFIIEAENRFHLLEVVEDIPAYQEMRTRQILYDTLGSASPEARVVFFEDHACRSTVLPAIFARNQVGVVQLFLLQENENVDIHILDEHGALFYQRLPLYDNRVLLQQFSRFLRASGSRRTHTAGLPHMDTVDGLPRCWLLERKAGAETRFSELVLSAEESLRPYMELQVIVKSDAQGQRGFTLYCDGLEFSSLEHGNRLYNTVARHILDSRLSGDSYPIYITDIALPERPGDEKLQTVDFLRYKKNIEARLNIALKEQALNGSPA